MFDLKAVLDASQDQSVSLIEEHVNPSFTKVLHVLGFDIPYTKGQGQYLWDAKGNRYLDCLSGFGQFACGRNHPVIREALKQAMDMNLPNLPKFGPARLSGILANELVKLAPGELSMVYFPNSGAEGVETALKYARAATGPPRMVFCRKGYHGLTMGALSANGGDEFREGFGELLPGFARVPFNDLAALEQELSRRDVAGFIVEPIQGKGCNVPSDDYLPGAAALCKKYGTLLIIDEVQTGYGRTGRMWACQHWNIEPDIMVTSKALSGGYVPVGAVLSKRWVHDKVFSSMDRCMVHSSTFSQNDLAMVAGLATLHVLRDEKLVENAAKMGELLKGKLSQMIGKYELVKEVRGKGLMVAVEFGAPSGMLLKAQWAALHKADASLFPQAVLMPLMHQHRVLCQTAGHHIDVIKLLPALVINEQDVDYIAGAFDQVVASCCTLSGAMWQVMKGMGKQLFKSSPTMEEAAKA